MHRSMNFCHWVSRPGCQKTNYNFPRFQRGSNIFQGCPTFSRWGPNTYSIETHITCDFPGGVQTPYPPSRSAHFLLMLVLFVSAWGYGILFVTAINLCSLGGLVVLPFIHHSLYKKILIYMIALAVGTLCGSSLLFLIPEVSLSFVHSFLKKPHEKLVRRRRKIQQSHTAYQHMAS